MHEENNPDLRSFIPVANDHHFPIQNLPFGIFKRKDFQNPRVGIAIGDYVLDLAVIEAHGLFDGPCLKNQCVFESNSLNKFLAIGKTAWREARKTISRLLRDDQPILRDHNELRQKAFILRKDVEMLLPVEVLGYTDFYASKEHATNLGTMFRGKDNPLPENWLHLPIGYDGRASSVVVSGTNFHRPYGQVKPSEHEGPIFIPTQKLDCELEVACVLGMPNTRGKSITTQQAPDHVFGLVLLNDWSARDIQRWEYVPLGPFLGKNFCSSISPWIVTLDALEPFKVDGPLQDPEPLPYLRMKENCALNICLEMWLQTKKMQAAQRISTTNYRHLYWNFCQQLAHHTSNGCLMQVGDLLGSGTISGPTVDSFGSLIELSWNGSRPLSLASGEQRCFLEDEDVLTLTGWCQGEKYRIGFGEVVGKVLSPLVI
jgi:fumarylacetoacetase